MFKILTFIRHNALALLALFVALGGTSYAAFSLPAGSVGTKQLRNGAITPAKLDAHTIGGSVRHWAFVNQDATVIGGSRGTRVSLGPNGAPYYVSWGDQFPHSCAVLANSPGTEGNGPIGDSIGIHVNEPVGRRGSTVVRVFPYSNATFVNARFYIAVVC